MHVDGFRFDLASILGRGRDGEVLADPPLLEPIAEHPVLARTQADRRGLGRGRALPGRQVSRAWGRWAEWNGQFRDECAAS